MNVLGLIPADTVERFSREEVQASWRHITRTKLHRIHPQAARLENATWRVWVQKTRNLLKAAPASAYLPTLAPNSAGLPFLCDDVQLRELCKGSGSFDDEHDNQVDCIEHGHGKEWENIEDDSDLSEDNEDDEYEVYNHYVGNASMSGGAIHMPSTARKNVETASPSPLARIRRHASVNDPRKLSIDSALNIATILSLDSLPKPSSSHSYSPSSYNTRPVENDWNSFSISSPVSPSLMNKKNSSKCGHSTIGQKSVRFNPVVHISSPHTCTCSCSNKKSGYKENSLHVSACSRLLMLPASGATSSLALFSTANLFSTGSNISLKTISSRFDSHLTITGGRLRDSVINFGFDYGSHAGHISLANDTRQQHRTCTVTYYRDVPHLSTVVDECDENDDYYSLDQIGPADSDSADSLSDPYTVSMIKLPDRSVEISSEDSWSTRFGVTVINFIADTMDLVFAKANRGEC